ncbi:MAG: exopolysaccharide biosynthesis protein [Verrucomicrobia bacterium]|nr:exopolysaccharide biosynthesis protein [Verrucomicrobiota bacterium]
MATDAAPDSEENPALPPRRLSEELARLETMFAERAVSLQELIVLLHGRAYILLLMLLALPFCTPIPLPGLSTPFGFVIALIALRLTLGQKPWLPQKLLRTELPVGFFGKLVSFTRRMVGIFEKLLRPRLLPVTDSVVLQRLHTLVILLSALALLLPIPIPFTNMFPAWAILLIAGGLLERDGLFVLAGHIMFAAGVAYFLLLGEAAQKLMEAVRHYFTS